MRNFFFLILVILTGCKQYDISQKSETGSKLETKSALVSPSGITGENIGNIKETVDSNGIKIVRKWEFDHFEPESNRVIGLWPECCGNKKFAGIKEYKDKWGFNAVIVAGMENSFQMAIRNGYEPQNIFAVVHQFKTADKIINVIDNLDAKIYYIDEPLERGDFSPEELIRIAKHLEVVKPGAKLILGSYQLTWWFYKFFPPVTYGSAYGEILDSTNNVLLMCDLYTGDQTSDWKSFYDTYGAENIYGHFIHSKIDSNEYVKLLDTTNFRSDIKRIFYFHGSNGAPGKTQEFCETAWRKGWMKKFEREFIYYLKCTDKKNNKPCSKFRKIKTVRTNNIRIAKIKIR